MSWQSAMEYSSIWITAIVVAVGIAAALGYLSLKAYRKKVSTGKEGIVGEIGEYRGNGLVQVHGELWQVENKSNLDVGDRLEVLAVNGLMIKTKRI